MDYGLEYAAELGIDPSTYDTYTGPENHKTAAIPCPSCSTPFASQQFLDVHLNSCRKKNQVASLIDGNKQRSLAASIPCIVATCGTTFGSKRAMMKHYRTLHLDEKFPCNDPNCSKVFSQKGHMQRHYNSVHLKQKPYEID